MPQVGSCRRGASIVLLLALATGADWPQFRGPSGEGASNDTGLPLQWSATQNIVWRRELPGFGSSSPITLGNRIYLTSYTGYGLGQESPGDIETLVRHVLCLDRATGRILWDRPIPAAQPENKYEGFQALHGYASSTPATDGQRLYVFFGKSGVFCFDLAGKPLWSRSVGDKTHNWGSGTSPVLYKNLVIINANVESGSLWALDKLTGSVVWQTPGGVIAAWNTPLLVQAPGGKTEVVLSMRKLLKGYDPDTGNELWQCQGIEDYICPTAIAHDGVIYAIGARKSAALAVRAGGRGDVTESHVLWRADKGSNVSSPVYYNGHLYWASESKGTVYCADAKTGEIVYEKRLEPRPDRIYASPVVADGRLYYVSRDQGTFVLAAEPEFKLLAHNMIDTDDSIFNASPVVSNNQLLLRSDQALYCVGSKGEVGKRKSGKK